MSVTDDKIHPDADAAARELIRSVITATGQTALAVIVHQFARRGRKIVGAQLFATAVTAVISGDVGIVQPGGIIEQPTLSAAGNNTGLELDAAIRAVSPTGVYLRKAAENNVAFSSAYTINAADVAGQWWGAVRIQMDSAGVITTKVVSADQAFATEALALVAVPNADADKINLGTVTVRTKSGVSFVFNTGLITGAGGGAEDAATVNWNPVASGLASALTGAITPVAGSPVAGTLQSSLSRVVVKKGGLLVASYTTDGAGAATNLIFRIDHRLFPASGEVALS